MCVATVRGALKPIPGVTKVEIEEGNKDFKVSYQPSKVKVDDLLKKLEEANEPAAKKGS